MRFGDLAMAAMKCLIYLYLYLPFFKASPEKQLPYEYTVRILNPQANSVIECSDGEITGVTEVRIQILTSDSNIQLSDYEVSIYVDPDSFSTEDLDRINLSQFEHHPPPIFSRILPGNRTMGVLLRHITSGLLLSVTTVDFMVLCEDNMQNPSSFVDVSVVSSRNYQAGEFDRREYFNRVYKYGYWSSGTTSASGPGSSLEFTKRARKFLETILSGHDWGIRRVIDVPCGDMYWMDINWLRSRNIRYVGLDVSSLIIAQNRLKFQRETALEGSTLTAGDSAGGTCHFDTFDIVKDSFSEIYSTSDLIICRQLMMHLPSEDNLIVLRKLFSSGARWLLLTTYLRADDNDAEFLFALGHKVNLFKPPYCLPDPVQLVLDDQPDMYIALWDLTLNTSVGHCA